MIFNSYNVKNEKFLKAMEDTRSHIDKVNSIILFFVDKLKERGLQHDASKLESPEAETFAEYTDKLKVMTYGSDEYKQCLAEMKPALDHHYEVNSHHPEHFANGISGMSLVDIFELLSDWKAATLRHEDGDLMVSINTNQERFNYTDELKSILINTAKLLYTYRVEITRVNENTEFYVSDKLEEIKTDIYNLYGYNATERENIHKIINDYFQTGKYGDASFIVGDAEITVRCYRQKYMGGN